MELTQRDVSERLGVTQQTYARLEANPASVGFERLFKSVQRPWSGDRTSSREPLSDAKPEYGACTMILHFQPGGRNGDAMRFPV